MDRGSGASSREKIERSSPFHRSPHLWLFYNRLEEQKVSGAPKRTAVMYTHKV